MTTRKYEELNLIHKRTIGDYVRSQMMNKNEPWFWQDIYMPMSEWKKIIKKLCVEETFNYKEAEGDEFKFNGCDINDRSIFDVMYKVQGYFKKSPNKIGKKYEYMLTA